MSFEVNWDAIRLVVFDVDGTLYNQRRLRLLMLRDLLAHTVVTRSVETLSILRRYRKVREALGDQEIDGFDDVLVERTAGAAGVARAKVKSAVSEWMEHRPLAHVRACRYPHLVELFAALKRRNKIVAIFSDYPAIDKLRALDLTADVIVSSVDQNVGILKPNPRGLNHIMAATGIFPDQTVLIGDRTERDGEAARRAGVAALIRSDKPIQDWPSFSGYDSSIFSPLLDA